MPQEEGFVSKSKPYPYYLIWTGALNLGDTPGVFMNAQFVGLLLQIPVTITFPPTSKEPVLFRLITTDVEVFGGKKHPVYWDWSPGTAFPAPVGYIDDVAMTPGRPEISHPLTVPASAAAAGRHTITVLVNPDVPAGMRDDFVLMRIEAQNTIGAKIGW